MSRAIPILLRLLFHRPLVIFMLALVYGVAALMLVLVKGTGRGLLMVVIGAFATGALAALLTERIARYSHAAGSLGVPDHTRVMRQVQGWFLAIFVAGQLIMAAALGAPPVAALAALSSAAAAGVLLATTGGFWWLILAGTVGRWMGGWIPLEDWIMRPDVQAAAIAASGWMIWRWLQLPVKAERAGALAPSPLADARHEQAEPLPEAGPEARRADELMAEVATDVVSGRKLPAVLAAGFGYSVTGIWRARLWGIGFALLVLLGSHVLRGRRQGDMGYLLVTIGCCLVLLGQLQSVLQRWISTASEQSLLCLAPRWPEPRAVKRAVLQTILLMQAGSIGVWIFSSLLAISLGWITGQDLRVAGTGVLGASLACSGAVCAVLAHRRIRRWHASTVALIILVGAGGVVIAVGGASGMQMLFGAVLMLVPPGLAISWYARAPLRFPLEVDPRAIQPLR